MPNPGNSGVTRWTITATESIYGNAIPKKWHDQDGEWVRYSDYAALEERCKKLELAVKNAACDIELLGDDMDGDCRGSSKDVMTLDRIGRRLRAALSVETAKGKA